MSTRFEFMIIKVYSSDSLNSILRIIHTEGRSYTDNSAQTGYFYVQRLNHSKYLLLDQNRLVTVNKPMF